MKNLGLIYRINPTGEPWREPHGQMRQFHASHQTANRLRASRLKFTIISPQIQQGNRFSKSDHPLPLFIRKRIMWNHWLEAVTRGTGSWGSGGIGHSISGEGLKTSVKSNMTIIIRLQTWALKLYHITKNASSSN